MFFVLGGRWLQAVQLTSPASAPARRQLVHAACTLGAGNSEVAEVALWASGNLLQFAIEHSP